MCINVSLVMDTDIAAGGFEGICRDTVDGNSTVLEIPALYCCLEDHDHCAIFDLDLQ